MPGSVGTKFGVKFGTKFGVKSGVTPVDVSLMVIVLLVATIVPDVEPVLKRTRNCSAPSVTLSLFAVIINDPLLLLTVTLPLRAVVKSLAVIVPVTLSIVQYRTVPSSTFVVDTAIVVLAPSSIVFGLANIL